MYRKEIHEAFKIMQELAHHGVEIELNPRGYGVEVTWNDGSKDCYETIWSAAKAVEANCQW